MKRITFLICLIAFISIGTSFSQAPQPGGFTYGWDNYDQSDTIGLGNRIVTWNLTGARNISHAPVVGVHPRVYFGPDEIPDLLDKYANSESGIEAIETVKAYARILHLGSTYDQNASYASNSSGDQYVNNSGSWNMSSYYSSLLNQNPNTWAGVDSKFKLRTACMMSLEAYVCLLYPNDVDSVIGISNQQRAQLLAAAMDFWATLAIDDPNTTPSNFANIGGCHMALCYDFLYNYMTPAQRDNVREAISMCLRDYAVFGAEVYAFANTSNWITINNFEMIMNFAIEGEAGYQPNLTHEWMRGYHNFITYGWFPSGAGYEGIGKNYQFVTTLIACAKRGYSLLGHPHVRAYGTKFLPAITQPFGEGFTGYDVWGGSGIHPSKGMYKFKPTEIAGLKWTYPDNDTIDFVWRNYISTHSLNDAKGYVFSQIDPEDGYNALLLPTVIFCEDYSGETWNEQAENVQSLDYLADQRGLSVLRSSKDSLGLSVQFHARQNFGGHTHGDRLDFTLSGLGRIWIRKSYGGAPFHPSKYHSTLLIDDKGVSISDIDGQKARQPAKILQYNTNNEYSNVSADATYAYSWEWHWIPKYPQHDHNYLGNNGWIAANETWNDFLLYPQSEAHYDIPFYDYNHWLIPDKVERIVKRPYNMMNKVVRNVGVIRGNNPFILILDDVEKDGNAHNYKWLGQLARDLELDHYDVNLSDTDYRCDIILKEPTTSGNRKLLVRVLENTGYDDSTIPGYIDTLDYVDYFNGSTFVPNPNVVRPRLIIESNSVSPNFKVLLFPFEEGQDLPITHWNSAHDTLDVYFGDELKQLHFYKDSLENTQFVLVEHNEDNLHVKEFNSVFIRCYPNPVKQQLFIESNEVLSDLKVLDMNGQVLIQEKVHSKKCKFMTNELADGVYVVCLQTSDGRLLNRRIVIQH